MSEFGLGAIDDPVTGVDQAVTVVGVVVGHGEPRLVEAAQRG